MLQAGALQSAIFNSANFSSIATDAKGVIQIFNVGAERMLGYAAKEVVDKITPADISDAQELITRAEALSSELATHIAPGFEAWVYKASRSIEDIHERTYIRRDGSRFPAIVSVTALRDAEDAIIGYLLIGTDNTARKQIEAEQTQLAQRLRDHQFYTRSLFESNVDALTTTDASGIISDVNKQMEALTGCTRDELIGAPLKSFFTDQKRAEAGIRLALSQRKVTDYELTAQDRDGKQTVVSCNANTFYDRERKLQGVFASVRDITDRKQYEISLREATHIESGEIEIEHAAFSPGDLVQAVADVMSVQAQAKGIGFLVDVPEDLPAMVEGDAARLNQILTNLLSNAIKFTDRGDAARRAARGRRPGRGRTAFHRERHRHRHRARGADPAVHAVHPGRRIHHPALRRHRSGAIPPHPRRTGTDQAAHHCAGGRRPWTANAPRPLPPA